MPLYLQPRFLSIPSLLTLAFAGGWLRLRRRAADPVHGPSPRVRGSAKAANRVVAQLEEAARAGDTVQFFNAARSALQRTTGSDSDGDDIRQLLALADEANYSGHAPATVDFARWTQIVRRRMMGEKTS